MNNKSKKTFNSVNNKSNSQSDKEVHNKSNQKHNRNKLLIISLSAIVLLVIAFSIKKPGSSSQLTLAVSKQEDVRAEKVIDADIVIPISEISETVKYFPAQINGIELEALAVMAPDGTIRTAFNTCQVCYSSGRGYYVQDGDVLVCQNCGNRFAMEDVEVARGGCNPVPITEEYKTVSEDSIIISKEFLAEATVIFQNWK